MIAAAFIVGVAVGIALLAICNAWDRQARARVDALVNDALGPADVQRTRPASSSRKSGRVRTGGA